MPAAGNMLGDKPGTSYCFRKCCEAVRDGVPIEEIAQRYTTLEPCGSKAWFTGRCPLPDHEDRTPSFYIYPPGRWWCYGCGRGGDVVDLEFHCGDYGELWEAMIALAVEYDVELPRRPPSWFSRQERQKPIRDAIDRERVHHVRMLVYRLIWVPWLQRLPEWVTDEAEASAWDESWSMALRIYESRRSA